MPKSKIKRIEMNGRSWTNSMGKTMYPFDIEFEDGVMGKANTTSEEGPSYKIGDVVEYTLNGKDAKGNNKINGIKKIEEQRNGYRSYYDDPIVQKRISIDVSVECAVKFLSQLDQTELKKGQVPKLSTIFYDWMYAGGPDNQTLLDKRQCLKRAIEMNEIVCERETKAKEILKKAEELIAYHNSFFDDNNTESD